MAEEEYKPSEVNELGLHSLASGLLSNLGRQKDAYQALKQAQANVEATDAHVERSKRDLVDQAGLRHCAINILVSEHNINVRAEPPEKGYTRDTRTNRVTVERIYGTFPKRSPH